MREIITLQCNDCKNRNYTTTKNRKKHSDRMETQEILQRVPQAYRPQGSEVAQWRGRQAVMELRGVGSTVDHRSPKPRVGVRIPPPLPVWQLEAGAGSMTERADGTMATQVRKIEDR